MSKLAKIQESRKTRDDDLELVRKTTEVCSFLSFFFVHFPTIFLRLRYAQNNKDRLSDSIASTGYPSHG